jgi:hypothetical protein
MKTIKQQKASRRNFMLMSIVGMITVLKQFEEYYVRSYSLKGQINVIICNLRQLHKCMIEDKNSCPKNYLDGFYYNNSEKLLEKKE